MNEFHNQMRYKFPHIRSILLGDTRSPDNGILKSNYSLVSNLVVTILLTQPLSFLSIALGSTVKSGKGRGPSVNRGTSTILDRGRSSRSTNNDRNRSSRHSGRVSNGNSNRYYRIRARSGAKKKHKRQQETQPKRSDEAGSSELGRIHGKNRNWRVRRLGLFPGHMAGPTTALAQTRERGQAGVWLATLATNGTLRRRIIVATFNTDKARNLLGEQDFNKTITISHIREIVKAAVIRWLTDSDKTS